MSIQTYVPINDLPAPVTTGTTIQSFTDVWGEVWVAKNGVNGGNWSKARDALHARAYRTAAWTSSTANTVLAFDATMFDAFGMKLSDNSGFAVPVAGIYSVTALVAVQGTGTGQWISLNVQVAGANTINSNNTTAQTTSGTLQTGGTDIVKCNAGDTVKATVATIAAFTGMTGLTNTLSVSYRGTG